MKVFINGKESTFDGDSMKLFLEEKGFSFPCKARGVCGKCKICCQGLEPTDRDRRLLTEEEISSGVRLACDKTLKEGLDITADIKKRVSITECDGYAVLKDDYVEVGIIEGDLRERAVFDGDYPDRRAIESVIAHGLLDFLESYDVAKATTLYIIGTREKIEKISLADPDEGCRADGATFRLPAEEVCVLPLRGMDGSDALIVEKSRLTLDEAVEKVVRDVRFRVRL